MATECKIDGCSHPVKAKGLCVAHYGRLRRGQDLTKPLRHRSVGQNTAAMLTSTLR